MNKRVVNLVNLIDFRIFHPYLRSILVHLKISVRLGMFCQVLIKVNLLHALSPSLQPNTIKCEHKGL